MGLAINYGGLAATANSKTSATSIVATSTAAIPSGALVVMTAVMDFSGTGTSGPTIVQQSRSDSVGTTYTIAGEYSNAASGGETLTLFYGIAGAAGIPVGTTFTVTNNSLQACRILNVHYFTLLNGAAISANPVVTTGSFSATATTFNSLTLSGLDTTKEYLTFRAMGISSSGAAFTPTSGYTAATATDTTGGSVASNLGARGEWRIINAVTSVTSLPTAVTGAALNSSVFMAVPFDIPIVVPNAPNSAMMLGCGG